MRFKRENLLHEDIGNDSNAKEQPDEYKSVPNGEELPGKNRPSREKDPTMYKYYANKGYTSNKVTLL